MSGYYHITRAMIRKAESSLSRSTKRALKEGAEQFKNQDATYRKEEAVCE